MLGTQILWTVIKIAIIVLFLLNVAGVLTWLDRRQSAMIQDRVGPNRAVIKIFGKEIRIAGLLHTAADGVKFFTKEDFMPPKADPLLFAIAPMLALFAVVVLVAAIPMGDTMCLGRDMWTRAPVCSRPIDWEVVAPVGLGAGAALFFAAWMLRARAGAAIAGVLGVLAGAGIAYAATRGGDLRAVGQTCVDVASGNTVDGLTPAVSTIFPALLRNGVCGFDAGRGTVPVDMAVAPLNVGLLFIFAMAGQGIIGAAIAGWSSDNKFSLMGALRAASQMVSYEVTLGMSLIGAMMLYGTLRLDDMVRWQQEYAWGIFAQPIAFFLFFTAAVAETKRIPFDLPEAESELVSGYFTEYSGMKFGMFYLSEYMEVVTSSMLLVTIFLGGWALPFFHRDGLTISFGDLTLLHLPISHLAMSIIGPVAFFVKVAVVCWFQAFVRWSLPRFRYDQLMKLGWRVLLPASLANILITGCVYLAIDHAGPAAWDGLRVAADVSQGLVAVLALVFVVRGIVGMFTRRPKERSILGTSANLAARAGGTKITPMQA